LQAAERDAAVRVIARDGDPDRYAASLFVPRGSRGRLLALYAFNVELARLGERASEPQLGEIRLEWWREALKRGLAGEATGHPVADALGEAARDCALSAELLAGLIDARHFDVSVKIMPNAKTLDDYLDKTATTLFRLAAHMVNAETSSPQIEAAAKVAGVAYGLTGLMRALPVHAAMGRVDIPEDALRRHGTSSNAVLAGGTSPGLLAALAEERLKARAALDQSKRDIAALPAEGRRAFLPLALVEPYLSLLEKQSDPLRSSAGINPLSRLWRLGTYRFG
jgi:15-cis-phytoene synthase